MKRFIFTFGLLISMISVCFAAPPAGGEKRTFTITAYYSPLPGQDLYITGSYADEIRLNGEGRNGADGTPVGKGMIAAPRSYAFGTAIYVPGYGLGEVHDRGGAIVSANNSLKHDRLDIWVGYGDEGLQNALRWGIKTIDCYVYPKGHFDEIVTGEYTHAPRKFNRSLSNEDKGDDVTALQTILHDRGFLPVKATGYFGNQTELAVLAYQLYHGIIGDVTDEGAGTVGPNTQQFLESQWRERQFKLDNNETVYTYRLNTPLSIGDDGTAVRYMQSHLMSWGYLEESPSGYFGPKTKAAIAEWQYDAELIDNIEYGGRIGPKSLEHLDTIYTSPIVKSSEPTTYSPIQQPERSTVELTFPNPNIIGETLSMKDENDRVMLLQKILYSEGFLQVNPTGYFGNQTEKALINYQISRDIIPAKTSPGAGNFGPKTQKSMLSEWSD